LLFICKRERERRKSCCQTQILIWKQMILEIFHNFFSPDSGLKRNLFNQNNK
jgi:hypothetical protein